MKSQQLIDLTKQFIVIPSTRDNPDSLQDAVKFVADIVSKCPGVTIENFERDGVKSFLAYKGKKRPDKFDIILNGHVDVVPGKPEQFMPIEKNGNLYGRGALDMKGTTMVLADVFCEMVNKVPYSLGLQIVSDEEIGGYNGVRLQIEQGVRAEFVIMGEYANHRNTIYNAARGVCWAEIAFKGKTAHGGHLWHGENAVLKAGNFAAALIKRYPTPDRETWATTASIASLSTPNDTYNKVPDSAILKVDFRFTQEDPVFQSEESVRTFIAGLDPDAELINLATFEPAVKVEELNPYTQGLGAAIRKITKEKPQFLGRPAASDGRHYALFNTDIIEFGLFGQRPHSEDEYVSIDSFTEYQSILREFLKHPIPKNPKLKPDVPLHRTLLEQLLTIQTVSGNISANNSAIAFIESFLNKRGMHTKVYEYNGVRSLVSTTKPDNKQPTVLLNAHLDVVPAPNEMFALSKKGDKLIGRGVMDMKFAIASYLSLVDMLKDDIGTYDFGIMITSDEEIGSNNGTIRLLEDEKYKPRVVLIPDSGEGWRLETFAKGIQWIKLSASGKPGHSSRQWEGDSAIKKLLHAISKIELLIPPEAGPEDTTLSVGTIDGGTTANQIPKNATAMLDVRHGSQYDYDTIFPRIKAICQEDGVKATVKASGQPCENDPNNPYIKHFTEIVTKVTGEKHINSISYGVTDGRFFSAAGIPCIVIQPPAGDRHKDTEWLSAKGFDQFNVVLEQYVKQIAAVSELKPTKEKDIAHLAKLLNTANKPAYVWYATFGSGLDKERFMKYVEGGRPEGASFVLPGCRDKTPPIKDLFISLPYELYFSGNTDRYMDAGGMANLDVKRSAKSHTIARAYLITIEQFEDIAAQENYQGKPVRLPLTKAINAGYSPIANIEGDSVYDVLLYGGTRDRIPIFSLTSLRPRISYAVPGPAYTHFLCKGLSQNPKLNTESAVDYLASRPGIAGHYSKEDISEFFKTKPADEKSV
ncbi:MAG TPA: M20/M25/M40 family metallo-hydrolase [Candidatus Saccharimonadales bacterium]|nr:M20/M25/M40 family metallo-hydrolase [Candidatus Saccharimonadales bacterium]